MIRARLLGVPLLALLTVLPVTAPAQAANEPSAVTTKLYPSYIGSSGTARFYIGSTITFVGADAAREHRIISRQSLFATPWLANAEKATVRFRDAGTFRYYDPVNGDVQAAVTYLKSAKTDSGCWLRWSMRSTVPSGISYDLQWKRADWAGYRALKTDTRATSTTVTTHGVWSFRVRTDNRNKGVSSGWSPTAFCSNT